ncbi:MAG: glycosyltransferase family 4 protein [Synechococcales bacterium]|nr:glycosyltransferase family 4 protein [Synechococcales bacterium]
MPDIKMRFSSLFSECHTMRILHVIRHLEDAGNGGVNAAVNLAYCQAQAGHHVAVAAADGSYRKLLESEGITFFHLDHSNKIRVFIEGGKQFYKIIHQVKPDIVHAHTMLGSVLGKLWQWCSSYGLVATVHNEFQRSVVLMNLADRVITTTKAVASSMHQRGTPQAKLRVVPYGTIGSPRSTPTGQLVPAQLQHPAITSIGGMCVRKGMHDLIHAFYEIADQFPEAHLYLVGEGSDRSKLEEQVSHSAWKHRIHFEGFQKDPQRYLLSTDIFVLASHKEPFGLVLAEAREAGCAVVGSNVDGIPQVLDYGKAGILVPPQDVKALAAELANLLSNPQLIQEWRHKAQQNLDWLSVDRECQEILRVYQELSPTA